MDLLNNLDPTTALVLLGMCAGVTEFVKHLCAALFDDHNEWRPCAIIAAAGITGALTLLAQGGDPLMGAAIGFAASGFVTIAQNIGKEAI